MSKVNKYFGGFGGERECRRFDRLLAFFLILLFPELLSELSEIASSILPPDLERDRRLRG